VALVAAGCRGSAPSADAGRARDASPAPTVAVVSAQRCGECHGKMAEEWLPSAHARAARAPLYLAMRGQTKNGASCDRCHAPLAAQFGNDPTVQEGDTCDVCHSLRSATPTREAALLDLRLDDNVKFGPLCDAKNHYFHKMGCSPLHGEAAVCGACHLYYQPSPTGGEPIPIFTEFEEWQKGPYAAQGIECQRCHMPGSRAEVAVGAGERGSVPHHGFLGRDGKLRERALGMQLTVESAGDRVRVITELKNGGAAHDVPCGLPERRLIVSAEILDGGGAMTSHDERVYGRFLVDEKGAPAIFPRAVKVANDNRIAPDEVRKETFELTAPSAGKVKVAVIWRAVDRELARSIGAGPGEEATLLEAEVPFGAPDKKGRAQLPKTLAVHR
jgi:hypothetical protein